VVAGCLARVVRCWLRLPRYQKKTLGRARAALWRRFICSARPSAPGRGTQLHCLCDRGMLPGACCVRKGGGAGSCGTSVSASLLCTAPSLCASAPTVAALAEMFGIQDTELSSIARSARACVAPQPVVPSPCLGAAWRSSQLLQTAVGCVAAAHAEAACPSYAPSMPLHLRVWLPARSLPPQHRFRKCLPQCVRRLCPVDGRHKPRRQRQRCVPGMPWDGLQREAFAAGRPAMLAEFSTVTSFPRVWTAAFYDRLALHHQQPIGGPERALA